MNKLSKALLDARASGTPALLPYIMAGDGGYEKTAELIKLFEENGAAAIEIGIPFSDPVADGPVIQAAGLRALESGTSLRGVLQFLETLPQPAIPRIIMTYLNPVLNMGVDTFFAAANAANISAVIIPDLPLEEFEVCYNASQKENIPMIPLASPNTSSERLNEILAYTDGFIYAVTVSGVTGARSEFPDSLKNRLAEIKATARLPVAAGFGISEPHHIAELKECCDGFVIGSKLVEMAHNDNYEGIRRFMASALESGERGL